MDNINVDELADAINDLALTTHMGGMPLTALETAGYILSQIENTRELNRPRVDE